MNSSSRSTTAGSLSSCAGLRRKIRSRETVNSLLERRDRQSRKFPTSVLSVFSSAPNAQRASLKITQACRKYSRIHSELVVSAGRESFGAAKRLRQQLLLCFHIQQIAVALGVVMQKAAHRGKELTGLIEFIPFEFTR